MKDHKKISPLLIFAILFFVFPAFASGKLFNLNNPIPLIFLIIIAVNIFKKYSKNKSMPQTINVGGNFFESLVSGTKKAMLAFFLGLVALIFLFNSVVVVGAGMTGVVSLFGKVKDTELRSGIHLINPFAKVTKMSIRTEEYTMSIVKDEGRKSGADAISALTKEGLQVDLDITVLYHLEENKASDIYRDINLDYEEKLLRPTVRSTIREIIAQYEAKDIYSEKREEAAKQINERLKEILGIRGIVMEDVLLRNVVLPRSLANAIQEKLSAEQEAQKYDFLLQREQKEKQRKIIEAEGQRDSQSIINESLSTNYLYFQYISSLKDRQGTVYVPTSPTSGMPLFRELGK